MIITDTKLASFKNMIKNFADRNDIRYEVRTSTSKKTTEVDLGTFYKYRNYVVEWNEAPNLSEAAARIFADAIREFKLKDNITDTFNNPSFEIKDVIFNNPATIVLWEDGTKTVVKCQPGDIYDKEMGLALCIAKKALGNKSNFNNVFKKWIPDEPTTIADITPIDYLSNNNSISDAVNNFYKNVQNFFGGNKND
jgi:hypothetical protein